MISGQIGRYHLQEIIGRGASSIVYRAVDAEQHVVAVKVIREELLVEAEREKTLERVAREARIGKLLDHPHLIRLFDWGEYNGMPYLVMDLLHGEHFDEVIGNRPLPPATACAIISDVLAGLAYAHSRRVVHRDIKPANIVLRAPSGDPVLMDFGIAHLAGSTLTQLGDLLGTPAYLSPEQLRGEPADHRADIFAVGVMLYEAVLGHRPFEGSVAEVMRSILFDEPAPPSASRPDLAPLDPVIARALAKDPARRFPSASAFAETLARLAFAADTLVSTGAAPADDAVLEHIPDTQTVDRLEQALERTAAQGLDDALAKSIRELLTHVPLADEPRAAALCCGRGLIAVAEQLYATAPLPGRDATAGADPDIWSEWAHLAKQLCEFGLRSSRGAAAERVMATLANALACEILVYASDVGERLIADEAPDLEMLAPELARVEQVARCLGLFSAPREQRLVEAAVQLVTGQILRRAATFINRYARDRDPLSRFDVVNMLMQSEALIAVTNRLLDDTTAPEMNSAGANIITARNVAALSVFLDALSILVGVSEELLEAEIRSDDENVLYEFVGHVRQVRLIYRFAVRFDREAHGRQLASLVRRIYAVCVQVSEDLIAMPTSSPFLRQRLSALHDLADDLAWNELAAHLLAHLRRLAVVADDEAAIG